MQIILTDDIKKINIFGLEIMKSKKFNRSKFNFSTYKSIKTIRCKLLYIVSLVLNIKIKVPDFEWRARGCE